MARKVIEISTCDACAVKGAETEAVGELSIADDSYDLCKDHETAFRDELRKTFRADSSGQVQKIA